MGRSKKKFDVVDKEDKKDCCGESDCPTGECETGECETGTCGTEQSGDQACECIPQPVQDAVIPCGTAKMVGQERVYRTTTGRWLTRGRFKEWSKERGIEVDPIVWFTEMKKVPLPPDVKP